MTPNYELNHSELSEGETHGMGNEEPIGAVG